MANQRIAIAMSGDINSSVSAWWFQTEGHWVTDFLIINWDLFFNQEILTSKVTHFYHLGLDDQSPVWVSEQHYLTVKNIKTDTQSAINQSQKRTWLCSNQVQIDDFKLMHGDNYSQMFQTEAKFHYQEHSVCAPVKIKNQQSRLVQYDSSDGITLGQEKVILWSHNWCGRRLT